LEGTKIELLQKYTTADIIKTTIDAKRTSAAGDRCSEVII
jgi:hypothetical protein